MKLLNVFFLTFILLILSLNGHAANKNSDSIPPRYKQNEEWYLQLQGGMGYIAAENTRFMNFWDMLSPQMTFTIGKRFTPVWGARLQLVGGKDKGVYFANDRNSPQYTFDHYGVMGVGSFNLTEFLNRKKSNNSQKNWNVSALFGIGALYTGFDVPKDAASHNVDYNNHVYVSLFGGVEVARYLSPNWEVNMELSTNWMNNNYNGQKTTTNSIFKADGLVNLFVGVRYTFNSTRSKSRIRPTITATEDGLMQSIAKSEKNVTSAMTHKPDSVQTIKAQVYYSIEDLLEMVDNKESIRGKMLASTERVFFDYGKSHIKTFTFIYLDKVVELLNKTNLVLVIKGFYSHGNPITNNSLAERRINAVRDYLLKHEIARDRLTYQYVELPKPEDEKNNLEQAVEFGILPL